MNIDIIIIPNHIIVFTPQYKQKLISFNNTCLNMNNNILINTLVRII